MQIRRPTLRGAVHSERAQGGERDEGVRVPHGQGVAIIHEYYGQYGPPPDKKQKEGIQPKEAFYAYN